MSESPAWSIIGVRNGCRLEIPLLSWSLILPILLLVLLANAAPVLARFVLRGHLRQPLDGGRRLPDHRRVLGPTKTLGGLLAALLMTAAGAVVLGFDWRLGLVIGAAAMIGDLASSFVKRRLGRPPHSRMPLLDELPEAALPTAAVALPLELGWWDGLVVVAAFVLLHTVLNPAAECLRCRLRQR